jgi:hypothetical protein
VITPADGFSRRRFLRLLAALGLSGLAAGCGWRATPTATPVLPPTFTPSPRPSSPATPTATATAAAPSPSPATPTATPAPPTPTATPFPPGPPSKLGVFIARYEPSLFELLQTGNVALVKTLEYDSNFVADIKAISPQTLVIARHTPLPTPDLAHFDPSAAARAFVETLLPIATEPRRQAAIDAWEAYNEPVPADAGQMAALAAFEAERTRLLAAAGLRSCIGNFGAGQPALELWPAFYPALAAIREHGGFLGLHEYSAPYLWFGSGPHQLDPGADEGDTGWLTLRYRKVYRHYLEPAGLAVPLVITELGIDGGVAPRPGPPGLGWRDFAAFWEAEGRVRTTAAGFYIEQLAWYDAELQKDAYVRGAAIYALAAFAGWASFELLGPAVSILQQYLAVHPPR